LVDGKLLQISLKKLYQKYVFHNRGTDLLRATISNLKTGKRHLFVCSSEESMSGLREVLEYRNEHLQVDLMVLPYSNDIDMLFKCVVRYIANRPFDFIWIGIGTPKQDVLANLLSKVQNGSFILCVGAALDFMAGTKKEAPTIMRNLGFEWLYRLSQEPRRLFKRYFFESWGFFSIVISRNIEIGDS
jgi:N-acetylglucosaminyldiphosphoundecaprenol N-acetyl-beta-D-mannosaminyltransferase